MFLTWNQAITSINDDYCWLCHKEIILLPMEKLRQNFIFFPKAVQPSTTSWTVPFHLDAIAKKNMKYHKI